MFEVLRYEVREGLILGARYGVYADGMTSRCWPAREYDPRLADGSIVITDAVENR